MGLSTVLTVMRELANSETGKEWKTSPTVKREASGNMQGNPLQKAVPHKDSGNITQQ